MPNWMSCFIYNVAVYIYNREIFTKRREHSDSEFFSDEQLDDLQTKKLRALLHHAKNSSSYYATVLKEIDVQSFTVAMISELPVLSKEVLRARTKEICSSKYNKSELIKSETSGSTGDAFIFYRDKKWDASHRAAIWRGMNQHGVEPWERNLYLWGFVFNPLTRLKLMFLDGLQNRFRIFQISNSEIRKKFKKISTVKYISGYSSVISMLAYLVEENNLSFSRLKMVKGTSEKIYASYQDRALRAFGMPIISEYGAAETGIISFTCPEGKDHTIRENVIVESVEGKAVVTNLESFSMPIIRLELGDYIELGNEECACGRHTQIIQDVIGRVGVTIVGAEREYPSLTLYYIFKELALSHGVLLSYQGYQSEAARLTLRIFEKEGEFDPLLVERVAKKYLPDLEIFVELGSLDNRDKKVRDFVSLIGSE